MLDGRTFAARVYDVVRQIPTGSVTTYGHVALLVDAPRCARQVGRALRELPRDLAWGAPKPALATGANSGDTQARHHLVPWHRVVNAQGRVSLRGDAGSLAAQVVLLRGEGVAVTEEGILPKGLDAAGWFPEPWDIEMVAPHR
ncbi:MAG: MGMT family protein [Chloroflexota bacterium]